jgi:ParB family transcriptional regulator, chromosome partitioning protein
MGSTTNVPTQHSKLDNLRASGHSLAMAKPALGRGLGALLGSPAIPLPPDPGAIQNSSTTEEGARTAVRSVVLARIRPCPFQPRKVFSADALRDLADSIRVQGIVQPLIVRAAADGYELIAGERRWRAAQLAGLTEVPVIVREADDRAALELALIENLQRENLNPIEEAHGFAQLIDQFQLTQEQAAVRVGKSRTVVANALRLLKLAPDLQAHVRDERLSVGHAKALLGLADQEQQILAADRVLRQSLNVRQTEDLVAQLQLQAAPSRPQGTRARPSVVADPHVDQIQAQLRERLGTKVELRYRQGRGALQIHFFNDDDLERVLGILGIVPD